MVLVLVPAFLLSLLGLSAIATVGDAGLKFGQLEAAGSFPALGVGRRHDRSLRAAASAASTRDFWGCWWLDSWCCCCFPEFLNPWSVLETGHVGGSVWSCLICSLQSWPGWRGAC